MFGNFRDHAIIGFRCDLSGPLLQPRFVNAHHVRFVEFFQHLVNDRSQGTAFDLFFHL